MADSMLRAALEKQNLGGGFMFAGPDTAIASPGLPPVVLASRSAFTIQASLYFAATSAM